MCKTLKDAVLRAEQERVNAVRAGKFLVALIHDTIQRQAEIEQRDE